MGEVLLEAEGIGKRYGRRVALDGFELTLGSGEIHGLLGPNGSGKTTALHILTGLLGADGGTVTIGGDPIDETSSRRNFGFAPDDLPLPGALTGLEYLQLHDSLRGRSDFPSTDTLIAEFGLTDELGKAVADYSHGMRRKLQVVAAVMHEPRVLVLDEPYRGLDPYASAALRDLILDVAAGGGAVLIATHDLLRAERDCHRVTLLDHGVTVLQDDVDALIGPDCTLEHVFLERTAVAA